MTHNKKLGFFLSALFLIALPTAACASAATEASGEPAAVAAEPEEIEDAPEQGAASSTVILLFAPEESEARFIIDEVLRGEPTTVIGVTNEIAGQIQVDEENPTQTQIDSITVQTGALTTDNNLRNGAIRDLILNSGSFPVVTFTPTSIEGLPAQGAVGETYALTITGDLSVRDVTREVTFEASVTPVSESRIEGSAATTISRSDYGLTIPSVPNVADVGDEVILEIDFVAIAS
jgi:polyisoprenoid-binding protein YceI